MLKWNNGRGEWSRMAEWQSFLCFSKKLAFHSCAAMAHDRKIQIRTKKRPTFWTDFLEQQTRMKNPEWEWEWLDSTAIEHAAAPNITEAVSRSCHIFNTYWIDDVAFQFFTVFQIELKTGRRERLNFHRMYGTIVRTVQYIYDTRKISATLTCTVWWSSTVATQLLPVIECSDWWKYEWIGWCQQTLIKEFRWTVAYILQYVFISLSNKTNTEKTDNACSRIGVHSVY